MADDILDWFRDYAIKEGYAPLHAVVTRIDDLERQNKQLRQSLLDNYNLMQATLTRLDMERPSVPPYSET